MLTQFQPNNPSYVSHARALTLKAMGDEIVSEAKDQLISLDNDPDYDLNSQDGLVVLSAASGELNSDISMRFDPERNEIKNYNSITAPGVEDVPFESFSYSAKDDGKQDYRFEINGKLETVEYDPKSDLITTHL